MDVIEAEAVVLALRNERDGLKAELLAITAQRNALPRSDKKGAQELLHAADRLARRIKAISSQLREANHRYEAKERHGLWEIAVLNLWGQDGLTAVRHQLRNEKMKRDGVTCGKGCACLTDCGDFYEANGLPKPPASGAADTERHGSNEMNPAAPASLESGLVGVTMEPLNEARIDEIAKAQDDDEPWFTRQITKLEWRYFARAIEKAHGIAARAVPGEPT